MPDNITDATLASLINGLADAKRELFNLRFQLATGQLENTARIGQVKKDVARFNTEIRAREIEAAESATAEGAS
ncbi:MAG: 50S ribosomal protein L29 [Actinomycetota bacterium]